MVADPELDVAYPERYTSVVEVTTTDNRTLTHRVEYAKGTMQNPLTSEEIHAKYLNLATTVTTPAHAERIAEAVRQIDRSSDVVPFAGLLRSLPAAGARGRAERAKKSQPKTKRRA
jgi:2-methylcitrate dehydratase PrpD